MKPGSGNDRLALLNASKTSRMTEYQRDELAFQVKAHLQFCVQVTCLAATQNGCDSILEQSKMTLLRSAETLLPLLAPSTPGDVDVWLEAIHGMVQLIESDKDMASIVSESLSGRVIAPSEISWELWKSMPLKLVRKIALLRSHCFEASREPKRAESRFTKTTNFTPAEDRLLAWGIRKYTYDWARIRQDLLPNRTEKQIFLRKKNMVSSRGKKDNIIRIVVNCITMDLTAAEIELLENATAYYGTRQPDRWEEICREHLPYRAPKYLSMLWSDYVNKRNGKERAPLAPISVNEHKAQVDLG